MKETDVDRRDEKKRYKQYEAHKKQLPTGCLGAIDAVERHVLRYGPATGEAGVTMLEDLAEIFEQGTKDDALVRGTARSGPVRFTDGFLETYPARSWAGTEQRRLPRTVHRAEPAEA